MSALDYTYRGESACCWSFRSLERTAPHAQACAWQTTPMTPAQRHRAEGQAWSPKMPR